MAIDVETGTGSATANSYVSVIEADAYVEDFLRNAVGWTGLSAADKHTYLKEGTQALDGIYGARWRGYRSSSIQSLDWPRSSAVTPDGWSVSQTEIPTAVKNAVVELAWRALQDTAGPDADGTSALIPDGTAGDNLKVEEVSVGSLRERKEYFGTKSTVVRVRKVDLMLKNYIVAYGQVVRA
jgi:hypothetical protein